MANILKSKQKKIILSYDGEWLKYICAQGSKKKVINEFYSKNTKGMSSEDIVTLLKNSEISKNEKKKKIFVSHPSHFTTTRLMTLPSSDEKEIGEMVQLQIEKDAPYGEDETLTYFQLLDSDDRGYSRILLMITHQETVETATKLVEATHKDVERVSSELDGFSNWFKKYAEKNPQTGTEKAILFADIDNETTSLIFFYQSKPYFHRNFPIGASSLLEEGEEETARQQFISEVHRSMEAFEAEGFKLDCSEAILTGLSSQIKRLDVLVQQEFQFPTKNVSSFDSQVLEELVVEGESNDKASFTSLIGLVLDESKGDLTPKSVTIRKSLERKTKSLIVFGFQILIGIILACFFFLGVIHKDLKYRDFLEGKYQAVFQEANSLELLMSQLSAVNNNLYDRGRLTNSLIELKHYSPSDIRWNSLAYNRGEGIVLNGVSERIHKVFEMVQEIERSENFQQPEAKRVKKRIVRGEDVTDFEIDSPFVN